MVHWDQCRKISSIFKIRKSSIIFNHQNTLKKIQKSTNYRKCYKRRINKFNSFQVKRKKDDKSKYLLSNIKINFILIYVYDFFLNSYKKRFIIDQ